ncbi:MAG TPA: ABC transporter substrate-binding protein [Synergistaceae bacterium]|nr:ABC transporter substrate-binding protein [Synergistaceae bacterium]
MCRKFLTALLGSCSLFLLSGLPASGETTFTDQGGQTITLSEPIQKAVTIPIPSASMFIALDGDTSRLAGMHRLSKSAMEGFLLGRFFPQALNIRDDVVGEGFMPNVETLAALNPDIVFQWGSWGEDIIEPIRNAGLRVALFKYGTQEYLEGWISMFGSVLGKEEKAHTILAWHHATRKKLETAVAEIPEEERPRVLYLLRYASGLKVSGRDTYNDFSIRLAGGKNVAKEAAQFAEVNEEQLILWDPEVILLNGFEKGVCPEDLYSNPKLASLSAVRNRRIYKMPLGGYRWDPPNQESPLMWQWLATVLHPEKFHWDLRKEMTEKYLYLYGKKPTSQDFEQIFRVAMNKSSSNYETFFLPEEGALQNP